MKIPRAARSIARISVIALSLVCFVSPGASANPVLTVTIGGETRTYSRDALLARPDVTNVDVPADIAYGKPMRFRAIPLAALLTGLRAPADSVIETVALDGFAAHVPLELVTNTDPAKAIAWLAIETADAPWPPLPGKSVSAGPFYIVWTGAAAASIRSEQWAYQVAKLESQLSPVARWPELAVDPALPATHEARLGQALFITQCLPCHMINGAGSGDVGPDLNRPMNPTTYMTRAGLHALIRDPKSVRTWPTQIMPGFAEDQMSDKEIDQVIGYLAHIAGRDVGK
jgi:mono/diheme cytochrome c family protein